MYIVDVLDCVINSYRSVTSVLVCKYQTNIIISYFTLSIIWFNNYVYVIFTKIFYV